MPYVIWDWNGTLLDDTDCSIAALNAALRRRSLPPVTREWYRENFAFPVRPFYAKCGIDLEREDWDALAREYHDAYGRGEKRLNAEAVAALERVKALGCGQSLLSAHEQGLLDADVSACGVRGYFDFVCGADNLDGGSKEKWARALMARLGERGVRREAVVMVGDALHDKEVADALGVRCVLCAQGGHSAERLRAAAPTGDTLLSALALAMKSITRTTALR